VVPSLRKWHHDDAGLALAIYSSGSVAAQKLLLQYARAGGGGDGKNQEVEDLRPLFAGRYFDTVNAGLKTQSGSYVKIAEALGLASGQFGRVAFFSDNVKGTFGCFVLRSGLVDGLLIMPEQSRRLPLRQDLRRLLLCAKGMRL